MTSITHQYWPVCLLFSCLPLSCSEGNSDDDGGIGPASMAGEAGFSVATGGSATAGSGSTGPTQSGGTIAKPTEGDLEICQVSGRLTVGDPTRTPLLDDFDDGDARFQQNGLAGWWYTYRDETAGTQTPTGDFIEPVPGGLGDSGSALHVQGEGFSSWGSGFGAYLVFPEDRNACLFDASEYSGISFWARGFVEPDDSAPTGDAGLFRVQLIEKDITPVEEGGNCSVQDACWDSHRVRLAPSECWQKYSISFDEFAPDGWGFSGGELDTDELWLLGFEVSNGQTYDLWIDQIEFFVGEPVEEQPSCGDEGLGGAAGAAGALGG